MASTLACIGLDVDSLETLNEPPRADADPARRPHRRRRVGALRRPERRPRRRGRRRRGRDDRPRAVVRRPRPARSWHRLGPLGAVVQADVVDDAGEVAHPAGRRPRAAPPPDRRRRRAVRASVVGARPRDDRARRRGGVRAPPTPACSARPSPAPSRPAGAPSRSCPTGCSAPRASREPTAFLAGTVLDRRDPHPRRHRPGLPRRAGAHRRLRGDRVPAPAPSTRPRRWPATSWPARATSSSTSPRCGPSSRRGARSAAAAGPEPPRPRSPSAQPLVEPHLHAAGHPGDVVDHPAEGVLRRLERRGVGLAASLAASVTLASASSARRG